MRAPAVLWFAAIYGFGFAACSRARQLDVATHSTSIAQHVVTSNRAEIELLIAAEDVGALSGAIALGENEQRAIYFYDTPELEMFSKGLLLRARKMGDGSADSTVLSRFTNASDGPLPDMRCAKDGVSATSVCTLRQESEGDEIDEVADGKSEIGRLFSKEQRAFAKHVSPKLEMSNLSVFGPIQGRVWRPEVNEIDGSVTLEEWMLPNGASVVTISVKTAAADAKATLVDLRKFLDEHGVREITNSGTKTEAALDYFASTLD